MPEMGHGGMLRRWFGLCRPKNGERFWLHKNEPVASGRYVRCVRCKKRRNDWTEPPDQMVYVD